MKRGKNWRMLVSGMAKGAFLFSSAHPFLSRLLIARSYTKFRQGKVAYERNCFFRMDECINNDSPPLSSPIQALPPTTSQDSSAVASRSQSSHAETPPSDAAQMR